ncbi:MAG: hypothetical protein JWN94_1246 [Betaproteobacteria bacterium]|nr:hypothetical protein [Betaproteobacteria bacterium]
MLIKSIRGFSLSIPFKAAFKHASAIRSSTLSVWVEASTEGGICGFGEGCPRAYVTTENLTTAHRFFVENTDGWLHSIHDVETLRDWCLNKSEAIDKNPSAWCAAELAFLDLIGKCTDKAVDELLGLSPLNGRYLYSAVLGDDSADAFERQLNRYMQVGFENFKIKLSGDHERDLEKVRILENLNVSPGKVRADANNLWQDAESAIRFLDALKFSFYGIEEPLRSCDYQGMLKIAEALNTNIILDESFTRIDQLDRIVDSPDRWIINVRVSKLGGLLRSLNIIERARRQGFRMIIGAHVGETSILTRAALSIANNSRDILLAQEGAFGTHLLENDVAEPPLMFGERGVLDLSKSPQRAGLGLSIQHPGPFVQVLNASIEGS